MNREHRQLLDQKTETKTANVLKQDPNTQTNSTIQKQRVKRNANFNET